MKFGVLLNSRSIRLQTPKGVALKSVQADESAGTCKLAMSKEQNMNLNGEV